jgi:hypothetical protein
MENIRLVEAAPNGATYELDITEEWTNINGMPGLDDAQYLGDRG